MQETYSLEQCSFGSSGEDCFRLGAFGVRENVVEAVSWIKALKL